MMTFDYCDKCGPSIRAYVYAEMGSGLPLTYCGHCGTLYWNGIIEQGGSVVDDQRHLILAGSADFWGHKRNPKPNCPSGHPYSGDNLYMDPRGRRVCRACKREWARHKYGYKEFRV